MDSWEDIIEISCGRYHSVGLKADGTVIATGDNKNGECDVNAWRDIKFERRVQGVCQHCGGTFKGLFSKICTSCGKAKDY